MKKHWGFSLITFLFLPIMGTACMESVHVHNYEADWTGDNQSHWHGCIDCEDFIEKSEHVGGEATCKEKAICDICGLEYGETVDHSYDVIKNDAEYHWKECVCGEVDEQTKALHYGGENSCEEKAVCGLCGLEYGDYAEHCYEYINNDEKHHWYECECGEIDETTKAQHYGGVATETQKAKCKVCGQEYGEFAEHQHNYIQEKVEQKYLAKEATCTTSAKYYKSCICGEASDITFDYGEALKHDFSGAWITSSEAHWKTCEKADCEAIDGYQKHEGGKETCQAQAKCETCNTAYGDTLEHDYVVDNQNETHTWKECACGELDEDSVKEIEDKEDDVQNPQIPESEIIIPDGSGDMYDPYILNENGRVQISVASAGEYIYFYFEAPDDGNVRITDLVNVDDTDSWFINQYLGEKCLAETGDFEIWIAETYQLRIRPNTAGEIAFTFTFI